MTVLAVAVAAACTGDDDTTASTAPIPSAITDVPPPGSTVPATTAIPATTAVTPSTTAVPVDPGELGLLDAALDTDGVIDRDAALALVAAGYGPLPGVTAAPRPLADGGPPLRAVLEDRAALTVAQQTALAPIVERAGTALADAPASTSPRVPAAAAIVTRALAVFGRAVDEVPISLLELPLDNGDGTRNFSSADAHATAIVARLEDGELDCRIRINASSALDPAAGTADPAFVAAVARETFHCLQYAAGAAPIGDVPMWVLEGAAAYAAERVAGASATTSPAWQRWIGEPQRPLQRRTSDAIGFFALIGEGADAFAFAEVMLLDPSPASIRLRVEQSDLFDRWGRQYATRPAWEGGFAFSGPGAAGLLAPFTPVALTVDGPPVAVGGRDDLSATPYEITAPGDVLVVTAGASDRGAIRYENGQHDRLAEATQSLCLLPGGCTCPGIAADTLPIGEAGGDDVFVGVGPSSGPGPTLAVRSLPRWCQEVAVPPPVDVVDPCLVGSWRTRSYLAPVAPGVVQEITGGSGATVTFGADKSVRLDLATMTPVVITATGPTGAASTTTLTYRGAGTGTWRADGGVLEVAGVDPASFGIRVQVQAADGSPLGDADVAATDVRGAYYASLLGTARYACTTVSLALTHVLPGLGATAGFELVPG